jgi:RNA polymerase sigma-70 factor, ECF subfamily
MNPEHITIHTSEPGREEELTHRFKESDQGAFAELVRRNRSYAYALAMRFVWDHAAAEDVVQESFIRVWNHRESFREGMRFTTWLYSIVTRVGLDHCRRKKRWSSLVVRSASTPVESEQAESGDLAGDLHTAQTLECIRRLTEGLPDVQRAVFTLRDLQDLPVEEVGEITGLSADAIKANLYHARMRMRKLLRARGINDGR